MAKLVEIFDIEIVQRDSITKKIVGLLECKNSNIKNVHFEDKILCVSIITDGYIVQKDELYLDFKNTSESKIKQKRRLKANGKIIKGKK